MNIEIQTISLINKEIPQEIKGKRILVISDLHNNCLGKNNEILKNIVNDSSVDAIIIAGDLFNGIGKNNYSLDFLKFLVKEHKVYMVKGNHEDNLVYSDRDMYEFIMNYGENNDNFVLLDNECVDLWGVKLHGFTCEEKSYKRLFAKKVSLNEIEKKLGIADENCYNIVVSHNPANELCYRDWGANLIICGHLHGGFIRLFNRGMLTPQLVLFPKYTSGRYYLDENCELVISRGLGTHFPNLRLFNRPHLIIIEFE